MGHIELPVPVGTYWFIDKSILPFSFRYWCLIHDLYVISSVLALFGDGHGAVT